MSFRTLKIIGPGLCMASAELKEGVIKEFISPLGYEASSRWAMLEPGL
jgi:hypothetical protein